jgi:hypothetical protein
MKQTRKDGAPKAFFGIKARPPAIFPSFTLLIMLIQSTSLRNILRFLGAVLVSDRSEFPFTACSHRAGARLESLYDASLSGKSIEMPRYEPTLSELKAHLDQSAFMPNNISTVFHRYGY